MNLLLKHFLYFLSISVLFSSTLNAQVFINEITPDPGNYDGQGGEWTELYNSGASQADVSCWVLTDGEEIIVFPSGTVIPAGGYMLIYNSSFFNCPTCNWDPAIVTNLTASGVILLDLATCNCTNQTGCFSVTWDNGGKTDRVVLFDENALIVDAVYWGNGERYAAAGNPIPETIYATGANTANREITGSGAGCSLPATNNYDVPALTNPIWENSGGDITGCTTSKSRASGSGNPVDGGAFWTDDLWPTPGQANSIPDYDFSYSLNGGAPVNLTSSDEITLTVCSGATLSFNASVNAFNQVYNNDAGDAGNNEGGSARGGSNIDATGGLTLNSVPWTESPVTATGVTPLSFGPTAAITSNTTFRLYIKENTQGGIPNANASGCPAAGTTIFGSGSASECYIQKIIQVNVVNTLVSASFTCINGVSSVTVTPSNAAGLTYELLDQPAFTATGGNVVASNTTGQFLVSSNPVNNYFIRVSQSPSCASAIQATGTVCIKTPACPTLVLDAASTTSGGAKCPGDVMDMCIRTSGAGASTNLPYQGTVEWYRSTSAGFDPYDSPASDMICSAAITASGGGLPKAPGGGGLAANCAYLSGIFVDACGATEPDNEFLVLQTGTSALTVNNIAVGFPGSTIDITVASTTDFTNAFTGPISLASLQPASCPGLLVVVSNGGTIPANSTVVLFTSSGLQQSYDFSNFCNLGNVYVLIHNQDLSTATYANWNSLSASDGRATYVDFGEGCGGKSYTYTRTIPTGWTSNTDGDFVQFAAADGVTQGTSGGTVANAVTTAQPNTSNQILNNGCATPNFISPPTVPCCSYTIPASECGTTPFFIKGIVRPLYEGSPAPCSRTNATVVLNSSAISVTCPSASISGESAICSGNSTSFEVNLTDFGGCSTATVTYATDGVIQPAQGPLTISGNTVTVTGINTAGVITLESVTFGGCASTCSATLSGNHTVTVNNSPSAPTASAQSACEGALFPLSASGSEVLNWYSDPGQTTLVGSGTPLYYTGTTNTSLFVKSINPDNGCSSSATPVSVTVNPSPAVTAPNVSVSCGSPVNLSSSPSGGTGTLGLQWTGPNAFSSISEDPAVTSSGDSLIHDGVYRILVTDQNGCFNWAEATVSVSACLFPVEFLSFEVRTDGRNNILEWSTFNEVNHDYFEVERLNTENNTFVPIGKVTQNDPGQTVHHYSMTDNQPLFGYNYYRLKQIDFDGNFSYSEIKSVYRNEAFDFSFELVPNPAFHLSTIYFSQPLKHTTRAEVVGVMGEKRFSFIIESGTSSFPLNIQSLQAGSYIIVLTNPSGIFTHPLWIGQ